MLNREEKNYEYFLAIVKYGNISRAAETLYLTQPTLSKYLHRLEEDLEVTLFDRGSLPLKLTDAGRCYYEYVLSVIELNRKLEDKFRDIRDDKRGTVTVGVGTWRGSILLPAILPKFMDKYPHIKVNIVEGTSYAFESAMLSNQADFCIVTIPSHFGIQTTYESLGKEKLYLIGNKSHPLVQKALKIPTEPGKERMFAMRKLNGQMFVSMQSGQILKQHTNQIFAKYNVAPKEILSTENIDTAINMVSRVPCFSIVPSLCKYMQSLPENVAFFEIGSPPAEWELGMVYKKDAYLSSIVRLFMWEVKRFYQEAEGL